MTTARWLFLPALAAAIGCAGPSGGDSLRISWARDMLTVSSPGIPGGSVEIWYLEAFCRRGSTHRDWNETILPFRTEPIAADADGRRVRLHTVVDDRVDIEHDIRAGVDNVDFRLTITNRTAEPVDIEWAQPCMRVGGFTGLGQDEYYRRCFLFTDAGLTRMDQTHRETKARYVPGQVYVPAGVDLNDVNPRPISRTRPVNGLVGCFSADESMILAMAWDDTQELFQGIIVCIHSDLRIGGLKPRETKHRHGKLYVVPNDVPRLLARYRHDFPSGSR